MEKCEHVQRRALVELLEQLALASVLIEVNIAAGIARNDLLGIDDEA